MTKWNVVLWYQKLRGSSFLREEKKQKNVGRDGLPFSWMRAVGRSRSQFAAPSQASLGWALFPDKSGQVPNQRFGQRRKGTIFPAVLNSFLQGLPQNEAQRIFWGEGLRPHCVRKRVSERN